MIAALQHSIWGRCELLRVEGADWIVRVAADGKLLRVPPVARAQYAIVQATPSGKSGPTFASPLPVVAAPPVRDTSPSDRAARRMFESLRNGLPPADSQSRKTAIAFDLTANTFGRFLTETDHGGSSIVVRGDYGQGKTFALRVLEEMAVESRFLVARTEVDATEIQIHKPYHVYRDLMRHLCVPGGIPGIRGLTRHVSAFLKARFDTKGGRWYAWEARRFLMEQLDCAPLAWLLSDPRIDVDESLIGLLACDLQSTLAFARGSHITPGVPRDWPAFSASTQGDFASYVLCGIGRLSRLLGFKGFIIILDEMEKWQNLNWVDQSKAGNLLGGLIWGATAPEGQRDERNYPPTLEHSGRCGGYPFSTTARCHVGVAVAMTPRGSYGPERTWQTYGTIAMHDLPSLQVADVASYCRMMAPQYAAAYDLRPPTAQLIETMASRATAAFRRHGIATARSAVQAVITALDNWRSETWA